MKTFRLTMWLIVALSGLGLLSLRATTQAQGGNLLVNPGFDGPYSAYIPQTAEQQASCSAGICQTAQVPNGWFPFWIGKKLSVRASAHSPGRAATDRHAAGRPPPCTHQPIRRPEARGAPERRQNALAQPQKAGERSFFHAKKNPGAASQKPRGASQKHLFMSRNDFFCLPGFFVARQKSCEGPPTSFVTSPKKLFCPPEVFFMRKKHFFPLLAVFYTLPEVPVTPLGFFVTPPDGFVRHPAYFVMSQNRFYTLPEIFVTSTGSFFTTKKVPKTPFSPTSSLPLIPPNPALERGSSETPVRGSQNASRVAMRGLGRSRALSALLSAYFLKGVVPQWELTDIYKGMLQFMCSCSGWCCSSSSPRSRCGCRR